MAKPEKIKELIAQLKETLAQERENIEDMEQLVKQKVEREAGIWEYSYDELEKELFERFPSLEAKSYCLTFEDIPSPRRRVGALFTFFKRIVRKLTNPYTRMILAKQAELDKELIPMQLAIILSLQKIKDRLNTLEAHVQKILDLQEEILEDVTDNSPQTEDL